jgi:uncharacterized protein involved in exopolysaccharide biosynthesis
MEGQELVAQNTQGLTVRDSNRMPSLTLRDLAGMGFRQRRAVLLCFFSILLGTIAAALSWPKYRAATEILVRRERVDPVLTSEAGNSMIVNSEITEEELNSEVELIRSEDVLRAVVVECGLNHTKSLTEKLFHTGNAEAGRQAAIRTLGAHLDVETLPKTNIIRIAYTSNSPLLTAEVLNTLDNVYLEKHKEVHSPSGELAFFAQQVEHARKQLLEAEAQLKDFPRKAGTANPTLARDITLQKLNEFSASLGQTRAAIAETQERIQALDDLAKITPPRLTTQMRQQDDAPVLQQMKSTLLNLELKRSDMGAKFQPDYPPVRELDKEIAETRAAVSGEKPLNDVTTDQNPAYVWIESELVKARSDLRGYQARAAKTETIVEQTRSAATALDADGVDQNDLTHVVNAAEDNYLLYLRKREEARITDALDQRRILNAAIVQKAEIPMIPARSLAAIALLGAILAFTGSVAVVFALEYFDRSFRTPAEVEAELDIPVLAFLPEPETNGRRLLGSGMGRNKSAVN